MQVALARLHVIPNRREVASIVVAKLDRLSRSDVDFAGVLKLAQARKWALVAIDLGVDTSPPTGELLAKGMMSVAQWERRVIGERTSAAIQAAKRAGKHKGWMSTLPTATGESSLELRRPLAPSATADALNAGDLTTATGAQWTVNNVAKVRQRLLAAPAVA